jgi:uncharacterized protein (TIGR02284 family)
MTDANSRHDIEILNALIEATLDSADGYEQAAMDATNPAYRKLFQKRAQERRRVVSDLQRQVRALGGNPEDEDFVLAACRRVFLRLRESLTRGEDSVITEVECGEDYIRTRYEEAMEDDDLSVHIRTAVVRAYASVKTGHDQMRDLKRIRPGRVMT